MAVFYLKRGNTRPILEVALKNPDGSPHNLTGSTAWNLYIRLGLNTIFTRPMVKFGADANGVLRYTWVPADWNQPGGLPTPVRIYRPVVLEMEYEVLGGSEPLRFPNNGYDKLQITGEVVIMESQAALASTLGDLTVVSTATIA